MTLISEHLSMHSYSQYSVKWSPGAERLRAAGAYRGFCSMKQLGVFLLPLDRMLVHRRSFPCKLLGFPNNSPVPIYTPGWRKAMWELSVLPKNTTQCPRSGLEPGPLDLGTSALANHEATAPPHIDTHSHTLTYLRISLLLCFQTTLRLLSLLSGQWLVPYFQFLNLKSFLQSAYCKPVKNNSDIG